jgi:hypothetical protein
MPGKELRPPALDGSGVHGLMIPEHLTARALQGYEEALGLKHTSIWLARSMLAYYSGDGDVKETSEA